MGRQGKGRGKRGGQRMADHAMVTHTAELLPQLPFMEDKCSNNGLCLQGREHQIHSHPEVRRAGPIRQHAHEMSVRLVQLHNLFVLIVQRRTSDSRRLTEQGEEP